MIKLLRNRRALSTVVTTLIILVVSVLLATVVVNFATNVVSTRVQEENLALTKSHVWQNATSTPGSPSYSVASIMVINTGGRDVVINKLSVRGQECSWNQTDGANKYVLYSTTTGPISMDLPYVPDFGTVGISEVTIDSSIYNFTVAPGPLVLKSGYTMLIYIVNPDSISVNDVGLTVSLSLHTAQAVYYREANVEAVLMSP